MIDATQAQVPRVPKTGYSVRNCYFGVFHDANVFVDRYWREISALFSQITRTLRTLRDKPAPHLAHLRHDCRIASDTYV